MKPIQKQNLMIRRKARVRAVISGTAAKPRLSVYRSLGHIYAQLIDDDSSKTLVAASDLDMKKVKEGGKVVLATAVGKLLAERALKAGVKLVVFDRGGRKFHGRVKALAEGAREGGLQF